jgi:hypothetical protein
MRRIFGCVGLALALAVLPAMAADDKKPDTEKKTDDKKADDKPTTKDKHAPKDKKDAIEKLVVGGEISGKLVHWEGTQKYFTVQVALSVPDAGAIKHLADLDLQLKRQALARDFNGVRNTRIEMAKVQTYKKEDHNIDFQAGADMKVRVLHPMVYDDKGKPKKLTSKELAELKGPDKKLPGYTAEIADIRQDSYVTVYLPKTKRSKPAPGASKDDKPLADNKPEAIMLLIRGDAPTK